MPQAEEPGDWGVAGEMDTYASATSVPWVPDHAGTLPPPFGYEPFGGYRSYLSRLDTDGMWWKMMRPGAHGYGMLVAFHNPYVCCNPANGYWAIDDTDRVPLLFPAMVEWTSVIDPVNDRIVPQILSRYEEDLDFPPVGITNGWWLDDGEMMAWTNLIHDGDTVAGQPWDYVSDLDEILVGMAAPWQVLPITEPAALLLRNHLTYRAMRMDTHVLALTNCQLLELGGGEPEQDEYEDLSGFLPLNTPSNPRWGEDHGREDCEYELAAPWCRCGQEPTWVQVYQALIEPLTLRTYTTADLFVPDVLHDAWRLAQRKYLLGWLAVYARKTLGDTWSTWCWRRLSPFWDLPSLVELRRQLSRPSTSSATLPESLAGSSPQLTLFDS